MHEGAVCREIVDIVTEAAIENEIRKIYEIIVSVGPYSCIHEGQLNFYFDVMKQETGVHSLPVASACSICSVLRVPERPRF